MIHNRLVARACRMHSVDHAIGARRLAALGGSLEYQDNCVVVEVGGGNLPVEPSSRAGAARHQPFGRLPTTFAPSMMSTRT